jgi:uroporphyrin-3 C-methyltransferase
MNEEQPALTPLPAQPASPAVSGSESEARKVPPAPASGRAGLPGLLAGVAIVAAAVLGWQVFALRSGVAEVRQEVAQRLASGESAVAESRALSRQQQDAIAALQGKLGALEAQVAATEGQAAALESLYQEFSRTREDRVVAEAEHAIGMAAQQLQLAGNSEAALIAMQGAEVRLAAQDRGQLLSLRRALMRDIERLKAVPHVDVQGIALRLEVLLERVDTLPLAFAGELAENAVPPAGDAAASGAGGESSPLDFVAALAGDVWRELRTLVRIERLDQSEPVLLAPAQSTFLRENLKIRLLTARLALLARDGRTYAADLAQARGWIERFFDRRDMKVQEALAELLALEAMPVKVDQPAPSESIAALRLLQARAGEVRSTASGAAAAHDVATENPAPTPAAGSDAARPPAAGKR